MCAWFASFHFFYFFVLFLFSFAVFFGPHFFPLSLKTAHNVTPKYSLVGLILHQNRPVNALITFSNLFVLCQENAGEVLIACACLSFVVVHKKNKKNKKQCTYQCNNWSREMEIWEQLWIAARATTVWITWAACVTALAWILIPYPTMDCSSTTRLAPRPPKLLPLRQVSRSLA